MIARIGKVLAFALLLLVVACGSKVNQENYDQIKSGMTLEEVKGILGEPSEESGVGVGGMSAGAKVWKDGDKSISVTFMNDKVTVIAKNGF